MSVQFTRQLIIHFVNMAKEGIEVIQANNRRVAAAKKAAAGTARNLQMAKKAGDLAQGALEAAQKALEAAQKTIEVATKEHDEASEELKDAERSQKAALKKWEVVDLVEEDEEKLKNSNDISNSTKRAGVFSDSETNTNNKQIKSGSKIATEITVEGCGISEINGNYKRNVYYEGTPMYWKKGQWKGQDVLFTVCVSPRFNSWVIHCRLQPQGNGYYFYGNKNRTSVPPSDGWRVLGSLYGVKPPLKIT
eukprot:scaffold13791_cov36-Cyclotella_meneghiniana.AAC.2